MSAKKKQIPNIDEIMADIKSQPTVSVYPHLALALGLNRKSAYQAISNGDVASIKIGRRIRVPTAPLRARLGL